MKEDILEQIAEDYFSSQPGYFTKTNVKYRPDEDNIYGYISKTDSVNSDIDVVAIYGPDTNKVYVVNCKSWQGGLNVDKLIKEINAAIKDKKSKEIGKRDFWAHFRELCIPKWTDAFIKRLRLESGNNDDLIILYTLLCTKTTRKIDLDLDSSIQIFSTKLADYFKKIDPKVTLQFYIKKIDYYVDDVIKRIEEKNTPAVENTHLARTFQLLIASDHRILKRNRLVVEKIGEAKCHFCGNYFTDDDEPYICFDDYIETRFCVCKECRKEESEPKLKCSVCGNQIRRIKKIRPTTAST